MFEAVPPQYVAPVDSDIRDSGASVVRPVCSHSSTAAALELVRIGLKSVVDFSFRPGVPVGSMCPPQGARFRLPPRIRCHPLPARR